MKRVFVSVCLVILTVFFSACAGKVGLPNTGTAESTIAPATTSTGSTVEPTVSATLPEGFTDLSVRTIISKYFAQRKAYLQGAVDTIDVVVEPMVADEAAHKEKLVEAKATVENSVVVIDILRFDDRVAEVATTEIATFVINGETKQESVVHLIRVYQDQAGHLVVGSDGYAEETTGFVSASYLSGETFE